MTSGRLLAEGVLPFTVEARLLRELGERLVRQPEVALVELIKNAFDADATLCTLEYRTGESIRVGDDGVGMTLEAFADGWMRIGTSSKQGSAVSRTFGRKITGEKGIGRFAVRFLGATLHLESVAWDESRDAYTTLTALFDWPDFDRQEDLGSIQVPYRLAVADGEAETGTTLTVSSLRDSADKIDLDAVRTGSVGLVSPLRSLFQPLPDGGQGDSIKLSRQDPGFSVHIVGAEDDDEDLASAVLDCYVLRAQLTIADGRVHLDVFRRGEESPYLHISDEASGQIGQLRGDIRFFPRRKGTFRAQMVSGPVAYTWIAENSGVAVFDRDFRVQPYGAKGDDWLRLQADAARNQREPRSTLAQRHFPMSPEAKGDTAINWMLRLPQSAQLVGVIQVEGHRDGDQEGRRGLVPSADREGFVENRAFEEFVDLVRGAMEALAFVDKQTQLEQDAEEEEAEREKVRGETKAAIAAVQANTAIAATEKASIVAALKDSQLLADSQANTARERERQLEIMSLLGVVAGFMTHEFGIALKELKDARDELAAAASQGLVSTKHAETLGGRIASLEEFVTYSSGYIRGAKVLPEKPYPVLPRLKQVMRVFGQYAADRSIDVQIAVERELEAPLVPPSLYNGIALNLYSNALKAVTSKVSFDKESVAFRAWNDSGWHTLEVSDTGIGIGQTLRDRIFDPLFTTTSGVDDPLGSGMGLGLALVRRGAIAFGGTAQVVDPPPGFVTCIQVRLPMKDSS